MTEKLMIIACLVVIIIALEIIIKVMKVKIDKQRKSIANELRDKLSNSREVIYDLGDECNECINEFNEVIRNTKDLAAELKQDSGGIIGTINKVSRISEDDIEIRRRSKKDHYDVNKGMKAF